MDLTRNGNNVSIRPPPPERISEYYTVTNRIMLNSFRKLSHQDLGTQMRTLVFFILFYLYLWLEVDLRLIYHGGGTITNFPVFFRGWAFFKLFISWPGGLVEHLSAFLSQLFHFSWAGALVVTLQAWLICLCTSYILKAIGAARLCPLRFVLPILLLVPYCQYTYHFGTTFALLVALSFICLHLRITPKSTLAALVTFLITSLILYVIAGAAYLLFALFCAIYEVLFKRRWLTSAACPLLAVIIPCVIGVLIFDISIIDAFSNSLPFSWKALHYEILNTTTLTLYLLYLLIPVTALAIGLWRVFAEAGESKTSHRKAHRTRAQVFSRYAAQTCLLFAIAGIVVFFFHDKKRKVVFEVDYCAYHIPPPLEPSA